MEEDSKTGDCMVCGEQMCIIGGSYKARCANCGFKDACCF